MSFITLGLFWGGVAAVSSPILIHLLNRQRYKRIRWAAMEFLLLAFKRTRRRMQIEHLIILILRCLTVLMLGMALAQPLLGGVIVSGSRDVYVLVDDSYSMGYQSGEESTFNRAQSALKKIISDLNPKDNIRIVLLSDVMKKQIVPDYKPESKFEPSGETLTQHDIDRFIGEVGNLKPSDFHTDMYAGLEEMYHMIFEGENKEQLTKELYIITDFQRNAWGLASVRAVSAGGGAEEADVAVQQEKFRKLFDDLGQTRDGMEAKVILVDVGEENSDQKKENFIIENVTVDQKELVTGSYANFEVTVRNFGFTVKNASVEFYVDDAKTSLPPKPINNIKPNETGTATFRKQFSDNDAGAHYVTAVVRDELAADSTYCLGFKVRQGVKILVIDGDRQADDIKSESWVLRIALHPQSPDEAPAVGEQKLYILQPVVVGNLLTSRDQGYSNYDIVMMTNVKFTESSPSDEQIEALDSYVRNGGKLVIWLGDNVNSAEYNTRLFKGGKGLMPAELGEIKGARYSDTAELKDKTRLFTGELTHEIMRPLLISKILEREEESPDFSRYFMMKVPPKDTGIIARFEAINTFSDNLGERLPAIVEKRFPNNGGRVILLNTTADGEWTNMMISPKDAIYLVLVHQIVLHLMRSEQTNLLLGSPIEQTYTLAKQPVPANLQYKIPSDDKLRGVAETKVDKLSDDRYVLKGTVRDTFAAGPYLMQYTDIGQKDYFGVNVNLVESDLTRIEPDKLRGVYPEFKVHDVIRPGQAVTVLGINRSSNVWRIPWALMIIFLALESGLALLFGKRSSGT